MTDLDFQQAFEGLSPEEARALKEKIVQSVQGAIQAHRTQQLEPLIEQYKADMQAAPRGVKGNSIRAQIKARARARGIPVDSIDFS